MVVVGFQTPIITSIEAAGHDGEEDMRAGSCTEHVTALISNIWRRVDVKR
jgi:hypothetical protein